MTTTDSTRYRCHCGRPATGHYRTTSGALAPLCDHCSYLAVTGPPSDPPATLYLHDTVRVEISDAIDDCIVITVGDLDTADRMVLEVTRGEAREIVAGIAAVL